MKEEQMTLCPIAIAIGCQRCALLPVCPLKRIIGNYPKRQHPPVCKSEGRKD